MVPGRIGGMTEERDARGMPFYGSVVVDPVRALAPHRFPLHTLTVFRSAEHLPDPLLRLGCEAQMGVGADSNKSILLLYVFGLIFKLDSRFIAFLSTFLFSTFIELSYNFYINSSLA